MTPGRRILLAVAGLVVLLPLVAAAAFALLFDSDTLKVRVADAVRRSTGRELAIAGPVGLAWSLVPTIALREVSFSNPPGMSRPAMAVVSSVEVQVALLPLLSRRVEVRSVTLVGPDILLERNAAGTPNWVFTPAIAPATANPVPASPSPRMPVSIDSVRIRDGRIAWRAGGPPLDLRVQALTVAAAGPSDPVAVEGTLTLGTLGLAVQGTSGPLLAAGSAGWPLRLTAAGDGVAATADGTLGPGGALTLAIRVADVAALSATLGRDLPPLHDVQLSAVVGPTGASNMWLQVGASDLSAWVPGLRLVKGSAAAAGMEQPVSLAIEAMAGNTPVAIAATAGSPLLIAGDGPVPVQVTLAAAGATVAGQGTMTGFTGQALDLGVTARVPDLAALGALVGAALPVLRDVSLDARVSMSSTGAVALRAMRLSAPPGDISGDIVLGRMPRPSLRGSLVSQRLDLDALVAAMPKTAEPPPGPPAPSTAPPAAASGRVLPDAPLPFEALRRADADLRMSVNEALWRGVSYRAVDATALLQDGRLRIDPLQAQGPGGALQASLQADAAIPSVALTLQAPGLDAGALLAAFGAPETTSGSVDLDAQLRGTGVSLRAIAATLDGHVGLSLVDGSLDNGWLVGLLGDALRSIPVDMRGRSAVRCLALRLDAVGGQATTRALLLDATRLDLEGEGSVDLVNEMLDFRLRTLVRVGSTAIAVPVNLSGPWRSPKPKVAIGGAAGRGALVIGAPQGPDACPAQLALARGGRSGPLPTAAAEPARPSKPADLLRSLLR